MLRISDEQIKSTEELIALVEQKCSERFEGLPICVALFDTIADEYPSTADAEKAISRMMAYCSISSAIDGLYNHILDLEEQNRILTARLDAIQFPNKKYGVN